MLETFKMLHPVEIDAALVSYYIECATGLIKQYINNPEVNVENDFKNEVIGVAVWLCQMATSNNGGVSSVSQGGRSVSFFDATTQELPQHIKARLPRYVKAW